MKPDEIVRVYSIQDCLAYDNAASLGHFTSHRTYAYKEGDGGRDMWGKSYDWMREQMAERLPYYSGDYPMWAWLKRPNMRKERFDSPQWHSTKGSAVLIVADIPRGRMLLSDYDAWHAVLNNWPNYRNEADFDSDRLKDDEGGKRESWKDIFDIRAKSGDNLKWSGTGECVQACIDRIHFDEIVGIDLVGKTGRIVQRLAGPSSNHQKSGGSAARTSAWSRCALRLQV